MGVGGGGMGGLEEVIVGVLEGEGDDEGGDDGNEDGYGG